jgi:hypothetical protein
MINNSIPEDKRDNKQNESFLNESVRSVNEDIKLNRKYMSYVLRTLNTVKNSPYDQIKKHCLEIFRNCERDITKLIDEDKNTCKTINNNYFYTYDSCALLCQRRKG